MTDEETGADLGIGLFRLGPEFDHIQISVLPHRDPESLYLDLVAKANLKALHREFLMVYRNVKSPEELFRLRNAIHENMNTYDPVQFRYQDTASRANRDQKSLWAFGTVPYKHGIEAKRSGLLYFTPVAMKKGFPITLEGFGIPQSSKALHLWLKRLKDSLRQKGVIKADVLDCEFLVDHASPKFDNESRDKDKEAYRQSQRVKGKGGGKGRSERLPVLPRFHYVRPYGVAGWRPEERISRISLQQHWHSEKVRLQCDSSE